MYEKYRLALFYYLSHGGEGWSSRERRELKIAGSNPARATIPTGESPVNKSFKERQHEERFNYLAGTGN